MCFNNCGCNDSDEPKVIKKPFFIGEGLGDQIIPSLSDRIEPDFLIDDPAIDTPVSSVGIINTFTKPANRLITVTGVVYDQDDNPLPGAHVFEGGNSTNGTTTNLDGKFTFNIAQNSKIMISHLGLDSQTFLANSVPSKIVLTGTESLDVVNITANKPTVKTAGLGWIAGGLIVAVILGKLFGVDDNKPAKKNVKKKPVKAIL